MDSDKYERRAAILNQIGQYNRLINKLVIELEEINKGIKDKNIQKINKSILLTYDFIDDENELMKKLRKVYWKSKTNKKIPKNKQE